MNITIDIGNSRTKATVFRDDDIVEEMVVEGHSLQGVAQFCQRHACTAGIVCSVVDLDAEVEVAIQALPCSILRFTHQTPIPLVNRYHTPHTLGLDRLAAAVGAWTSHPDLPLLVIDAGSCITFDLVTAQGEYLGGNIAPGVHMRLQALSDYIPRLPLVEARGDLPALGYDTTTAIRSGVVQGTRHEIEGYIRHFQAIYPTLLVVLTGGDDLDLDVHDTPSHITIDHHVVARGLNRILRGEEVQIVQEFK